MVRGVGFRRLSVVFVLVLLAVASGPGASAKTINGGPGSDILFGTRKHDRLNGADDDDVIFGRGGNDVVNGGTGDDELFGGRGRNTLNGDAGKDSLVDDDGRPGDVLNGGADPGPIVSLDGAADTIDCGPDGGDALADPTDTVSNCDTVVTSSGSYFFPTFSMATDTVTVGTSAAETLTGTADPIQELFFGLGGPDTIDAGDGPDYLAGGAGKDHLNGEGGNDVIVDDDGRKGDVLNGSAGVDDLFSADGAKDHVDCGDGIDLAIVDKVDVVKNCETVVRKTRRG